MVLKYLANSEDTINLGRIVLISTFMGFVLSWGIYSIRWLSPFKINSGPNGILRAKGDLVLLFPWVSIYKYKFVDNKLILSFNDEGQTELILPKNIDIQVVKEELVKNMSKK